MEKFIWSIGKLKTEVVDICRITQPIIFVVFIYRSEILVVRMGSEQSRDGVVRTCMEDIRVHKHCSFSASNYTVVEVQWKQL